MTVRAPLLWDAGISSPRRMTTDEVSKIVDECAYQYSLDPSVTLAVTAGIAGGALSAAITDTRQTAGATSTGTTDFPNEATTAEPGQVTVTYQRINETAASVSPTTDTGRTWPAYLTATGNVQSMTLADVKDTFLHPAIDQLTSASTGTDQGGTYTVSTGTSLGGATLVDSNPIYLDTRADSAAYSAADIGETLDQPTTITSFYLQRVDGSDTSYTVPFYVNASNHLQEFDSATFESLLQGWIRYTAASSTDGYSISYNLGTSGSGNTRGSGMGDTRLNGSGNYQTRFVNTDDYRAQEFPNGTSTTINTYYLRINKS